MPRSSVFTPARIGASSVRIQHIHESNRRASWIDSGGLLDLRACPAEVVAHFIGNIDQAAHDGKGSVRGVNDPSHEMGVSEDCHEAAGGQPRCRARFTRIARGFTFRFQRALTKSVPHRQIRRDAANHARSRQAARRSSSRGSADICRAWSTFPDRKRIRIACSVRARSRCARLRTGPSGSRGEGRPRGHHGSAPALLRVKRAYAASRARHEVAGEWSRGSHQAIVFR